MRISIAAGLLASVMAVTWAAPALAQRDPFEPAIDTSVASEDATEDGSAGQRGSETEDAAPETAPGSEALAETGVPGDRWIGLAYALVALGAGGVLLSRVVSPRR